MSDGSPVLGPKVAMPSQGQTRSAPPIAQSGGQQGLPGVQVYPWRLQKQDTERRLVGFGTTTLLLPVDAIFLELK